MVLSPERDTAYVLAEGPGREFFAWSALEQKVMRRFASPPGFDDGCGRVSRMGVGHFRSREGRATYLAAYDAAMRSLPKPSGEHDIETEFGWVRAYRFGKRSGSPIVLLHGRAGTTAMWQPNVEALAKRYPVYSIDLLGEPGRSVQTLPIRDGQDQALWLNTVLTGLELGRIHLVGASIGGWLAHNQALRSPARIASLTLLDPANVLARVSVRMLLGATAAILPFTPEPVRQRFLSWISGGAPVAKDDLTARVISLGMQEYKMALPMPAYPSDSDLRSTTVPTLALIAGRSAVHDPQKALERAKSLLKDVEAELWPEASHAITGECAQKVNARVLSFVDRIEARQG